ncbi:MAG: hypothetical protein LBQ98_04945 [Nitrososphaerota archaeon]|jgi:hypothetical protein|nr:hypothetical protein [Nitrososphaerota archaeon]
MNRVVVFMLVFVFVWGLFAVGLGLVSAEPLVEDSWHTMAPMRQARSGLGVVAVDGKIYAIGGALDQYAIKILGTNEVYDPVSNTWTTLAPMPTPRTNFAIAACEGKIYCIGGIAGRTPADEWGLFYSLVLSDLVEVYDPATNTWTRKAPMPSVSDPVVVVGEQIFILDGFNLYMFDTSTNRWTERALMPVTPQSVISGGSGIASRPVVFVVDGKLVFTGEFCSRTPYLPVEGVRFSYGPSEPKVMVYDPMLDVWVEEAVGPMVFCYGVGLVTSGVFAPPRVYFLGQSPGSTFREVITNQAYDFADNTWRIGAAMPTSRVEFGAVVLDDLLYVIGGCTYVGYSEKAVYSVLNEVYVPFGYRSVPLVEVVSPLSEGVYDQSDGVDLEFVVDRPFSLLSYCVDGGGNVSVGGNVSLSGLSLGVHSVVVFVEDFFGNVEVSETVTFTVVSGSSFVSWVASFLTFSVLVVLGVVVGVVVAVLLVYFRRRRVRS